MSVESQNKQKQSCIFKELDLYVMMCVCLNPHISQSSVCAMLNVLVKEGTQNEGNTKRTEMYENRGETL
jgi:hypothetical protein